MQVALMLGMHSTRNPVKGFTLVEIIVVLLIIGVTVSLVFPRLVLPGRFGDLATHSQNITTLIRAAREESTFRGRILGIFAEDDAITVKRLVDGQWVESEAGSTRYDYSIKPPFSIGMNTQPLPLALSRVSQEPILFLPDGQSTVFELVITNKETGEKRIIKSDSIDIAFAE
jgi:prepilin-type N-terminal cleavage/methylation domain-containing protein